MSTIPNPATTDWVPVWGGFDLRYNGSWVAGTYTDGDIVIYNGVAYVAVRTTTATPAPWPSSPSAATYGTTLPASPVDGQEAILVDSITNPTYQWRFRYNAGNTTAYKWEFIGGSPCFITPPAYAPPGINTYYNDTQAGATIGVPRAGEYILSSGSNGGVAAGNHYMGFSYDPNTRVGLNIPAAGEANVFLQVRTTCTAAQVISNVFYSTVAGASFNHRSLSAQPIRVS